MHDEELSREADVEPAGLKEALIGRGIRTEAEPQYGEGQQVENGTDGAKDEHESRNRFSRPRLWMGAEAFIHPIPGKKNLRDVVEKILHEELDGPHRQEWKDHAGYEHAENVPEIRAEGDFDIFKDVARSGAALVDAREQGLEVLFHHDDLGGLAGEIGAGIGNNAHIGLAQGVGVIRTIAKKTDAMAFGSQH